MSRVYAGKDRRRGKHYACRRCKRVKPAVQFPIRFVPGGRAVRDPWCWPCRDTQPCRAPHSTGKRCANCGEIIHSNRSYVWTGEAFIHQRCISQ